MVDDREGELERDAKELGDKTKAAGKAVFKKAFNKADEAYSGIKTEYEKEKLKEKMD